MFTLGLAILVFFIAVGLAFLPRATLVGEDGYVDYIVYGPGAYWGGGHMDRPWWRRRWCPYRNCPWRRRAYAVVV